MPATIKQTFFIIIWTCMPGAMVCMPGYLFAQTVRKIERRADAAFTGKDYYTAAKLYSVILYDSPLVKESPSLLYPFQPGNHGSHGLIKTSRRNEVVFKLAESYRLYNHFKEAGSQYAQYIASQDTRFPLVGLWYGESLLANNEPQKAITAFTNFLQQHKSKDVYAEKAKQDIASANFVLSNRILTPRAVITKLSSTVSADGSDFAYEKINDSIFWFTTSRHELDKKQEKIFPVRLYAGNLNKNTSSKITGLSGDLNMATHSLSADGLTLYFTGWKNDLKTGVTPYHLFYMSRGAIDSAWKSPVMLPAPVNVNGFQSKQPFITKDGKYLLFASDQPGSIGKFDIWMVVMDGRKPVGRSVNLGSTINTIGDDVTPFYEADSALLYFSTDGRVGMGGLDIFQASGYPGQNQWTAVTNLGWPVNSVRDDQYYRKESSSSTAYLSSDRASSCCLEIFTAVNVKYIEPEKKDTGRGNHSAVMDSSSRLSISVSEIERMNKQLLDSINSITMERNYVYYNFASASIRKTDQPPLNDIANQLKTNPELNILIASFTDCIGSLSRNIHWARKRSESVKAYLIKKGIDPSRINIDFFGKKHFILPCLEGRYYNKEEQIANRRSDLILTKEATPKWRPSGRELDVDPLQVSPLYRSVNSNFDSKSYITKEVPETKPENGATLHANNSGKVKPAYEANTLLSDDKKKDILANDAAGNTAGSKNKMNADRSVVATSNTGEKNRQKNKTSYGYIRDSSIETLSRDKMNMVNSKPVDSGTVTQTRNLSLNEVLDFSPRVKTGVVAEMVKRIPRKPLFLYSVSDSVRIDLYDNGVFDYDTVSVIYDKQLVSYKQLLQTNKPIRFYVKLSTDPNKNEMILFAENLGFTPPNSALMVITDGENKRTEVNVTSDMEHNTVIYFIKVKKEKQ